MLKSGIYLLMMMIIGSVSAQTVKVDLNSNWQFRKKGDTQWMTAVVPGTVHTDLLQNKKIEDPFFRNNEKNLQWIGTSDWEYKMEFHADDQLLENDAIEIQFEGLDTYADVFINGTKVIAADNMFLLWKADIKKYLIKGQNNLSITFYSPLNKTMPIYDSLPYVVPVSNNDQADKRLSAFTRKAGYHYGWDWGPRFVTSGIWRPVTLLVWKKVHIEDLFIKQLKIEANNASLEAQMNLSSSSEGLKTLQLFVDDNQTPIITKNIMVFKGENNVAAKFEMNDIQLWWPNGMGNQKLYKFRAVILDKNIEIGSREVKRGLRTIELVNQTDEKGKSFYFKVNGKPVFMKGANYIPQDNFLPRVTKERYEHVINTAVSSHMNMLRVWGGGIYENDLFYDLCDEKGILVWQDFMFACTMVAPLEDVKMNIIAEAKYNVKRLRNHSSIALWCGNNEATQFINEKFWGHTKDNFKTAKDSASVFNTYDEVFHTLLPGVLKAYDDEKFYWSSSPNYENYSMKYKFNLASGDIHYWGVWWGKEPFEKYNEVVGRFMSEYGFQSFPELETVKKYTIPSDYDINSEVMTAHQRSTIGNGTITHYMKEMFTVPKKFENFLYVGQILQAEGIKIALEAHRRAKPYCMGTLNWQIDDCWPVASWSSIDYYGRWKAQQYMTKHAFNEYLISAVKEKDSIKIFAISDVYKSVNAIVQVSLMDFNGKVLKSKNMEVLLPENSSTHIVSFKENELVNLNNKKNVVLNLKLQTDNKQVSQNNFYFEKPKNLELSKVKVKMKQISDTTIELSTTKMAKSVWLFLPNVDNAFSDNYFDLLPNEKKIIEVKTKDLKSDWKRIEIKTLIDAY
ncbi:MAG: glycoside hydrolase family 2 protein [Flavobacterium sp.]|nr:glycoside hydrolase family 2 protein [Flavobacterium sp.]